VNQSTLALTAALAACTGCMTAEDGAELGEANQDMVSLNGTSLTGTTLTGTAAGGGALNGSSLLGVSVTGTSAGGAAITIGPSTGAPLTGAALVGSTWAAVSSNSVQTKLRIDSALQGTAPSTDLWFYAVSYQTTTGWSPLCGLDGANQPIRAVSVAGAWTSVTGDSAHYGANANRFTLACRTKTIAKCVELGYKPHKGYANQMAACVRMLRADYCGTGVSHTADGTTVNLYDNLGIQPDNQAWPAEAEWTTTGARCVNVNNTLRYERVRDPGCTSPPKTATCGASFAAGALLIDELVPGT
jgi:hypothetical protein